MAHWDRRELNKLVAESPEEYKKRFPEPFSAMIPEDASSENKLATEAYVNEHGGGGSGSDPEAVKYTEQTLTEEQKAQALANIGGASAESVTAETARATAAEEDIMDAMDGTNVEVVTALPTASASTVGKFYYVGPDGNGEYARYRGIESGGSYSFLPVGSTQIDLSTYATEGEVSQLRQEVTADVSQLEAEVTDLEGAFDITHSINLFDKSQPLNTGYIGSGGTIANTNGYNYSYAVPIEAGHYYLLAGRNQPTSNNVRCLDSNGSPLKVLVASTGNEYSSWSLPNEAGTGSVRNGQFLAPVGAVSFQFNAVWNNSGSVDNVMLIDLGTVYSANPSTPPYVPFGNNIALKSAALPDTLLSRIEDIEEDVQELDESVDNIYDVFDEVPSANLFDKSQPQGGGYINQSGEISADSGGNYIYSIPIPVQGGKYYYLSGRNLTGSYNVRCLDENGDPLKVLIASSGEEYSSWALPSMDGSGAAFNGMFKTPVGAVSFQFNIKFNDAGTADNVMVSFVGDSFDPVFPSPQYVPYGDSLVLKDTALPSSVAEELAEHEDSISEFEDIKGDTIDTITSPNLFDKSVPVNLGYIGSGGTIAPDSSGKYTYSYPIPVLPNRYYYLSGRTISNSLNVRCLDSNGSPLKVLVASTGNEYSSWSLPNEAGTGSVRNGQFKTPSDAAYFQFNIKFNDGGTADNVMLLDLGDTYTIPPVPPYQPYLEKTYKIKQSALPDGIGNDSLLSLLRGKTIRIFGGSVSRLSKTFGGDDVMEELTGCIIQNDGLDGGGYARGTEIVDGQPIFATGGICDKVNAATQAGQLAYDIYILWSSTNDTGCDVGEATDYTFFDSYNVNKLTTQNGGLNYCIKKLQTFAPESHIIVLGSLKAFDFGASATSKLHQLVDGQEAVAKLQSVPFYSLWDNGGVNYYNKDTFFTWTEEVEGDNRNDGTHPNTWAYQNVLAPKIIKQIALLW